MSETASRSEEITALRRQLERERAARREAEALLESKSLELFHVNRDLERRVAERVSELETAKTALHEAVDRAESANRVKSEFLARMSHEVRTPMTAILGYADILLRSGGLEAGSRRAVVAVRRNADHLLALLNDVLDLSKIEAGQMALQTERCRLLPIIAELESMMVMRAVERGLAFRVVYDTAVPKYLRTDRVRFQQILANLLGNAIKFTDAGTVTLRFRLDDHARAARRRAGWHGTRAGHLPPAGGDARRPHHGPLASRPRHRLHALARPRRDAGAHRSVPRAR
jgi:signal transduction histidine kinase